LSQAHFSFKITTISKQQFNLFLKGSKVRKIIIEEAKLPLQTVSKKSVGNEQCVKL